MYKYYMLHSSWKHFITGFDINISDKCKIQDYYLELRKKLKAYTMSRSNKIDIM